MESLISVDQLEVHLPSGPAMQSMFSKETPVVKAMDGVSFELDKGEIWPGRESGSGKTTTGKAILRLVEPTGGEYITRRRCPRV